MEKSIQYRSFKYLSKQVIMSQKQFTRKLFLMILIKLSHTIRQVFKTCNIYLFLYILLVKCNMLLLVPQRENVRTNVYKSRLINDQ